MKFTPLDLPEVILITPTIFTDERGFFTETYHAQKFAQAGILDTFIQDNHSKSTKGTLRGLHLQRPPHGQAKLVRCTQGTIFDVAVDIRPTSKTYKKWVGRILSADSKELLYIPSTFAHGFYVISDTAEIQYKCSTLYAPDFEQSIAYNDPSLNIQWPLIANCPILLSKKDAEAPNLDNNR